MPDKKIKFQYFKIFKLQDNERQAYNLVRLLASISQTELSQRNYMINGYKSKLENINLIANEANRYYYLRFVKLKDSFLPLRSYEDRASLPFELNDDEYLGEDVSIIYDSRLNVILLQRNRNSLSANDIEYYLTHFAREFEIIGESSKIQLSPVLGGTIPDRTSNITKAEFSFANITDYSSNQEETNLLKIIPILRNYGAISAKITISVGHYKNKRLDNNSVLTAIEDSEANSDIVKSARVTFMNDEVNCYYDLFDNILYEEHIFHLDRHTSLEATELWPVMMNKYQNRLPTILQLCGDDDD